MHLQKHLPFYENLEGSTSPEYAERLAELAASQAQYPICVDIGAFGGRTTVAMAAGCASRMTGDVIAVDPWSPCYSTDGVEDPKALEYWGKLDHQHIYEGFLRALLACPERVSKHISVLRTDSELAIDWLDRTPTLVHIDGNRSRLKSDAEAWGEILATGGMIVIGSPEVPEGVQACRYLQTCGKFKLETQLGAFSPVYRKIS